MYFIREEMKKKRRAYSHSLMVILTESAWTFLLRDTEHGLSYFTFLDF